MAGGIEGERPRGELTPDQQKQNSPEAGAGPLGVSPPDPEQQPHEEGSKSPERQPLLGHGEGQDEPADLNVSSANTEDVESPQAELNSKSPIIGSPPKRRWRSSLIGGGRLHGYSYGEDKGPSASENKGS
jgi:hypothetical protein